MLYPPETIYKFLDQLFHEVKQYDAVLLATLEEGMHDPRVNAALEQLFRGCYSVQTYRRRAEKLRVIKMRGIKIPSDVVGFSLNQSENELLTIQSKGTSGTSASMDVATKPERTMNLEKQRIAILPLNISPDPKDEYFADGMTEEVISAISLINELSVISRTSVMTYKNQQNKRTLDIGSELGVGTILEGSIRKAGDRVRISVQLIDVESDRHLWAQNYDRTLEDIFAIQSEIASRVAESLESQLLPGKKQRIENANTRNVDAHLFYLKGRDSYFKWTREGFENAIRYYEMAIEKDRRYALAFAGVAESCCMLGQYDMLPSEDMFLKAREFAEKALSIDNSLSDAHFVFALVSSHEWNFERAEIEFRRSIELNTSLSQPHFYLSDLLIVTQRFDEASSEAQTALELDPMSSVTCSYVGANYLYLKKYRQSH